MTRSGIVLVLTALTFWAGAQDRLTESIEVRVVNIDAVVTDRNGRPVTGLTAADFEILEDGKPQKITNFFEVRADESVSAVPGGQAEIVPAPPRRFVLFVDNDSLHPYNRKLLMDALRDFLKTHLRPGDLASVVSWNRALTIAAPFTDDRDSLMKAIDMVADQSSAAGIRTDFARVQKECARAIDMAKTGAIPMAVAYDQCIIAAREETMVTALLSRQLLNAIELAMTSVAGTEGKKILVLAGARLPRNPGEEIYQWANQLFAPLLRGFDAPMRRPDQNEEQLDFLQRVGRAANAHGVTLHTIAATISTDVSTPDYQHPIDHSGADYLNQANTFDAFAVLSDMTGGTSITRPRDYRSALLSILSETETYYSLGYRPQSTSGEHRRIVVRAKNRDLIVRTRETTALKTADEVMSDRTIANLYAPVAATKSWKPVVVAGKPTPAGKNFTVPFEVTIPPSLTLLPTENELTGGYTLYVAVGTPQGALSTVFRQPQPIAIPLAHEKAFRSEPLTFGATLTVRPGENILSIGVVDQVSGDQAFARTKLLAK